MLAGRQTDRQIQTKREKERKGGGGGHRQTNRQTDKQTQTQNTETQGEHCISVPANARDCFQKASQIRLSFFLGCFL